MARRLGPIAASGVECNFGPWTRSVSLPGGPSGPGPGPQRDAEQSRARQEIAYAVRILRTERFPRQRSASTARSSARRQVVLLAIQKLTANRARLAGFGPISQLGLVPALCVGQCGTPCLVNLTRGSRPKPLTISRVIKRPGGCERSFLCDQAESHEYQLTRIDARRRPNPLQPDYGQEF